MHRNTKVATCCYCGMRAALVLGAGRHELTCSACGAPLSALKSLRSDTTRSPAPAAPLERPAALPARRSVRKPKKKPRKSGFRRLVGEFIDEIDDIFD